MASRAATIRVKTGSDVEGLEGTERKTNDRNMYLEAGV
jgi:hypothetical protein